MATINNSSDHQVTQYNIITGGASNILNNVAPSATSGIPVISQGSSAQPIFGTAVVAGGGTGLTSATAYTLLAGGTTTTGAFQSLTAGSSGQILQSNGSSALPTWINSSASGGVTFLNSQTASNSASISFTSTYITASYNTYLILFNKIVPVNNIVNFQLQVSINNGSTYVNSSYESGLFVIAFDNASAANINATSLVYITSSTSNNAAGGFSGAIYMSLASNDAIFTGTTTSFNGSSGKWQLNLQGSGVSAGGVVNNIILFTSSGNISSGTMSLYGINT